jgi:hypothetical protein
MGPTDNTRLMELVIWSLFVYFFLSDSTTSWFFDLCFPCCLESLFSIHLWNCSGVCPVWRHTGCLFDLISLLSPIYMFFFSYLTNTMRMIPHPTISVATPFSPRTIILASGGPINSAYISYSQRGSGKAPISAGDLDFSSPRRPFPPPPQSYPLLLCNHWPQCRHLPYIVDLSLAYISNPSCQVNALHFAENAEHVLPQRNPR